MSCHFGSTISVPASALSFSIAMCESPLHSSPGWVDVSLLSYNSPLLAASSFYYTAPLYFVDVSGGHELHSISPNAGPTAGGTIVTLFGSNLYDTPDAMCRFGERGVEVFARSTGARSLECTSPAHASGTVPVELSLNGQQFTTSFERLFDYRPTLTVFSLSPYSGPIDGDATVYVSGKYFHSDRSLSTLCRFHRTTSLATVVTSTEVKCKAPSIGQQGYASVEVTNNLQDYSVSGLQFFYVVTTVEYIHPALVSQAGGTRVMIYGHNFILPTDGHLWCKFGTAGPKFAVWK